MDSLNHGVDRLVDVTFAWLSSLIGALIILFLGHVVAKALAKAVRRLLQRAQFDNRLHAGHGGSMLQKAVPEPTGLIERVTYWIIFLGALSLAATILGIDALNRFIAAIYGFIPQLIAAILIFLVGSAIAAGVTTLVRNTMGDTPTGKLVESIAPVIVIGLTVFMILDQLNVAPAIVTITYAALIGSVALGSALAFGLGGREVAGRMLEKAYEKGRQNAGQVKRDAQVGKERAKEQVRDASNRARR
jgi:hypothetical protein